MKVYADGIGRLCQEAVREAGGAACVLRAERFAGLNPLCAVGAEDGCAQGERGFVGGSEHRDRAVAIAAQCQQQCAFGAHGIVAGLVVDGRKPRPNVTARFEAFDADGALGRGWQPIELRQRMTHAGFAKALKPGSGKQGHVSFTRLQFGKPRGDIAAKADNGEVWAGVKQLRGAARCAGADARAGWDSLDGGCTHQNVAHVGTWKDGGDHEIFRADGFNVFHRMDRKVDFARYQPGIEFFGPQRLSADFSERAVLNLVTRGSDRDQFDHRFGPAMRRAKPRTRFKSLRHGERGAACAELERLCWQAEIGRSVHAPLAVNAIISRGKCLMALILGIESSCDETAAAVIDSNGTSLEARIVAQRIASQDDAHRPYGGVVPEIAARAHVEVLAPMIAAVLADAGLGLSDMDAIAATAGPGLIGGVMVGLVTGKALAMAAGKPLIAVNHLEGHALSPRLADPALQYPYLLLLVSGGHCQILEVAGVGQYRRLATTIDDALGEAFDKTAKILGLGYPGGPAVERMAKEGDAKAVRLPRPLVGSGEVHFSFAGLKSAVMRAKETGLYADADIAASFQQAAIDCVIDRTRIALAAASPGMTALVVAGGVAANAALRGSLEALAGAHGLTLVAPPPKLCTDNAAMIGWAGAERFALGYVDALDVAARPRWPLDENAAPVRGAGVKA